MTIYSIFQHSREGYTHYVKSAYYLKRQMGTDHIVTGDDTGGSYAYH